MFNVLLSVHKLFLLSLFSFFILSLIRKIFIKKKMLIFLYHITLFSILFIASIGGGVVQNDEYERLKEFILLEKNNQLEYAKKNPHNYSQMLKIDLQVFKNSNEFEEYIKKQDKAIDIAESIFVGWMFTLLSEVSEIIVWALFYTWNKIKIRI